MRSFILITILFSSLVAFSQRTVTGRVVDKTTKKPLANATVRLFPTTIKTSTNVLGYFQMTITTLDSLLIQYPGYLSVMLKVPQKNSFQVSMQKRKEEIENPNR